MNILDQYVTSAPGPQSALDIFRGEWVSILPGALAGLRAGSAPLFADERIEWCAVQLGGLHGKTVLELGPLEAGHTYMLEQLGAASILAIEANTHHYLKCLIVKELLNLQRAHFVCGDFVEYLRTTPVRFDVALASGVLYHMHNPVELIALLARAADQLFIWTHYYDPALIARNPELARKFTGSQPAEHAGFRHTLFRQEYQDALDRSDFCGRSATYSHWLTRADILDALKHFGFEDIRLSFDHPQHFHGPSLALIAQRHTAGHTRPSLVYVPEPPKRLRRLLSEAARHYRRGGLRRLAREVRDFWRRRRPRRIE